MHQYYCEMRVFLKFMAPGARQEKDKNRQKYKVNLRQVLRIFLIKDPIGEQISPFR